MKLSRIETSIILVVPVVFLAFEIFFTAYIKTPLLKKLPQKKEEQV
jgi:hypothetical protein